jgi:protein-disulfide isomerase
MPDMPTSTPPTQQKSNPIFILILPLVFFLGLGSGYLLWGRNSAAPAAEITPGSKRVNVSAGDAPSLGPKNAPITIIEFSDYQCPYCKLWHDDVYDRLLANYPAKVRFVYRDLPLTGHSEALPAAEAAQCAGAQNAYWEYHDDLFGQQYGLSRSAYLQYAQDLGLNVAAFTTCIDSHRYQSKVKDSLNYAIGVGVQSTPTFFINGIAVIGAESYETFKQIIDQELAGQNQ